MNIPTVSLVCPDEVRRDFYEHEWKRTRMVFRRFDHVFCLGENAMVLDCHYDYGWGYVKVWLKTSNTQMFVSVRDVFLDSGEHE